MDNHQGGVDEKGETFITKGGTNHPQGEKCWGDDEHVGHKKKKPPF